jgi:hypothetical protein
MRFLVVVLLLVAGCSHVSIDARSHTGAISAVPPAGTSVTGGGASVSIHSHSLAALVIAGMFMAAAIDYSREERPFPSFSTFSDWFRGTPRRELSADRPVAERDCTQPLGELSENLKCR